MPGSIGSMELSAYVHDRWPPIEIIIASALFDIRNADLPARRVFLRKPYLTQDLAAALRGFAP